MSPALVKMWIALSSMVFMFIAVFFIYFSRYKLNNKPLKMIFSSAAYIFLVFAGLIILFVVFTGPVNE
ncbi:DUF2768 domain-containing protein [Metabacillus sp. GX 13764]|uniref:DUF2768 domain-containing protein n=1 Tax=Metabacillus kandeliae TaxID=2900151 RepID=UPI001E49A470|nr:DUF2768 domain-containing protein [Metabacillus kandeliae]MCD7033354.1 DUF2768 domain-containing protein [Metabacillus kandeliae]